LQAPYQINGAEGKKMRIKQIDYYINEDHKKSILPPIYVDKFELCSARDFDYTELAMEIVESLVESFKLRFNLPDAVATAHLK
jgi:hypothetical protein